MATRITWRGDIATINGDVIGTVRPSDAVSAWAAQGCFSEWEDTQLGSYATEAEARDAIEQWAEEQLASHKTESETEEVRQLKKELEEAREWKAHVLAALRGIPEWSAGSWAGDKTGWGFNLEFVAWLGRELKKLARYSISPELTEQYKGEALAARWALGLAADSTEVSPSLITARIAALRDRALQARGEL